MQRRKFLFIFLLYIFPVHTIKAQDGNNPPPQASQFNFWIGKWDLYADNTLMGHGRKHSHFDFRWLCSVSDESVRTGKVISLL